MADESAWAIDQWRQTHKHEPVLPPSPSQFVLTRPCIYSGWMLKRGHMRKNWKRRWFLLNTEELLYFASDRDVRPIRSIAVRGSHVTADVAQNFNRSHLFELVDAERRVYYLQCESAAERRRWMNAIVEVLGLPSGTVGYPFDVKRKLFVQASDDPSSQELLSESWALALQRSSFTKEEFEANSAHILRVISVIAEEIRRSSALLVDAGPSSSSPLSSPQAPRSSDLSAYIQSGRVVPRRSDVPLKGLESVLNSDDPRKIYPHLVRIGHGGFGEVFLSQDKDTRRNVAIKQMVLGGRNREEHLLQEILILRDVSHKNIIEYVDCYRVAQTIWVVTAYYGGGALSEIVDLYHFVDGDAVDAVGMDGGAERAFDGEGSSGEFPCARLIRRRLSEPQMAYIMRELLDALSYLHLQRRIHRDLKSANVLLTSTGEVKLADFGFAIQLQTRTQHRRSVLGTAYWMAPEMIMGNSYGQKIDVWSLGVILHEMVFGDPPYVTVEPVRALLYISTVGVPFSACQAAGLTFSPEMEDFWQQCLCLSPDRRASAAELRQHKWLDTACSADDLIPWIERAQSRRGDKNCTLF